MENNTVMCPLMEENIDVWICFDICMVAERQAPKRTAPSKAVQIEGFHEICLECKNHVE
ncbi:MAG: hypothetical protein Q4C55_01275 [Eubacterium sp.]|nr:hypothetical protein [Eubacterium sp.]